MPEWEERSEEAELLLVVDLTTTMVFSTTEISTTSTMVDSTILISTTATTEISTIF